MNFLQEPLSSEACWHRMQAHLGRQATISCGRNLYPCFSCSLNSLHTRKKDNPGKEAYKLAHGHTREPIGAAEVSEKASSSHKNQWRSGK